MTPTIIEILTAFRSGTLSAQDAAEQLLPLLRTSGGLGFELTPEIRPVLEALNRLAGPSSAAPQTPLVWESPHWQRLGRVPEDFWNILRERRLTQAPHCLRYAFTVRSAAAASALEDWILDNSDHEVTRELPPSFEHASGQVVGLTPPRLLTREDLQKWAAWLQAISPIPDAALTDLGIVAPPEDAG
jgi:hypothetical protein